ncbi:MAG TPA: glycosyltransferase family 2 protein [Thermoanaerobaculia bacterium]|jgi:undecaprenyl-phosphate 4-deoxy-4-formamido-L-arabinose transferase|nr:glycosyltransferase family 2 protein [Thermoanaerobaculia bacterium]
MADPSVPQVSVVVPAYNSEATLPLLVEQTREVLRRRGNTCEFVIVNDNSLDGTWAAVQRLAASAPDVRGLRLNRNFGQHNALLAGIREARGEIIVTIDDDLQHPPEEIPKVLDELERGADVVYGFPRELPHSLFRNVFSWLTKIALQKAMGADTARHASAFRAFRTHVRRAFEHYRSAYVSIDVLLTWGTQRFSWVAVEHRPRRLGKSNFTLQKLATHALTMITGFSTVPLRFASILGLAFTIFGIAILAFVVGRYVIQGGAVPGFPFLASTIAVFSGAQLFAIGIIGEYLARVHMRMLGRPAYLVSETTFGPPADSPRDA